MQEDAFYPWVMSIKVWEKVEEVELLTETLDTIYWRPKW